MRAGRRPPRTLLPDTVGAAHQQPTFVPGRANQANTDPQPRGRELDGGLEAALGRDCWGALKQQAARGVEGLTAQADAVN